MACLAVITIALVILQPNLAASEDRPVAAVQTGAEGSNAVAKVIAMLQDLSVGCKKEKDAEAVAFAEFSTFCKMETAQLKKEIEDGGVTIDSLMAEIAKTTSQAKALGEEIAKLQDSIADWEANKKEEEEQRAKEHAAYEAQVKDYAQSVDALGRAIAVMEKGNKDVPGAAAALLQLSNTVALTPQVQQYYSSLLIALQTGDAGPGYAAPEANAYEGQSGGIIDTLKKLEADFRQQKGQCEKEEMNAAHASNMIVQDLVDSIENAKEDVATKTKLKAEKEARVAEAKGELESTQTVLAENKKMLSDLEAECRQKTASFEEKQHLRTEEIEAIEKAIEIMSSDDVSLTQGPLQKAASLLQVARNYNGAKTVASLVAVRRRVREFLEDEGRRLKSTAFVLLAQRVGDVIIDASMSTSMEASSTSASAPEGEEAEKVDPFAKVKKLIWDMIQKMEKEAAADAAHEGFCDTEMGKSKVTPNKLNEDIDGLYAKIDELKAFIAELAGEIATLSAEVSELNEAMKTATEDRKTEKAKNKQIIVDAQAGQKAVAAAIAVLKDFYEKAQKATALVQQQAGKGIKMGSDEWEALANPNFDGVIDPGHKAGMQTFGKAYKGNSESAGPILGLMEVIESDFANLESDTSAAEEVSQKAYEEFMADAKKNVAVKERKIEMDEADKATSETTLLDATKDLKSTEDELLAADRYFEKIKPQCVEAGVTPEQRAAQRQAEIQSLKEALEILST